MKKYNVSKVLLIVLDGFGLAAPSNGNPITSKNMPILSSLISTYKSSSLVAAGLVVGLEWGTYGNSEVGHSALGTGRVVVQILARVNTEIRNKKFFKNDAFLKVLSHAKKNKSKIHLIGCVSPGGIHAHQDHLIALLEFFKGNKFSEIYVHMITDGEDSFKEEGLKSLEKIRKNLSKSGAQIASLIGRNFAMDRLKNWPLTKKAWEVMVEGGNKQSIKPEDYIQESYKKGVYDPDIEPASFPDKNGKTINIENGDGIIFFNFRNDRIKQLVAPFVFSDFKEFKRAQVPKDLMVASMTNYNDDFKVLVAYPPEVIPMTLGEAISKAGLKQLRVAESEKEAHVTNFFNGGKLDAYPKEERLISTSQSLLGKGYLEHPEMSLSKITKNIIDNIDKPYSLIVANFANSDMVAHTGNLAATKKALSIVDASIEKIIKSTDFSKTAVVITADHGNAEELIDPATNEPDTQHSTTDVPVVFISEALKEESKKNLDNLYKETPTGSLIDIAPTILSFLGIAQPKEMTGSRMVN